MHGSRKRLASKLIAVCLSTAVSFGTAFASDTKGRVTGTIFGSDAKPVVGARVTMQSPTQTETLATDAQGHFAFLSLGPDTYIMTVHRDGYLDEKRTNIAVQADVVKDESVMLQTRLGEIGSVTARSRSSLVQPGVTTDVYSINPAQQSVSHALGGGNTRDSITSSLAGVPGTFVPIGQAPGWGQSVFLRGGDYTQTGFEFDGVPLNRPFDQYAASPLSSLGSAEIQVYTGAAPIDQQTQGIGGYVNQVVKSGSYPNSITADLGIGSPSLYNKAALEFSGANGPDKKFTYHVAAGGYGFRQRLIDQYNGKGVVAKYGPIAGHAPAACGPNNTGSCYDNGATTNYLGGLPIQPNGYDTLPTFWGLQPGGSATDVIGNFHFAIPHHRDGNRDDLQFLYTNSLARTAPNASVGELGAANVQAYQPYYLDQNFYSGPRFTNLGNGTLGSITNAFFAGHQGIGYNDPLRASQSDSQTDAFWLSKLSYRHAIGNDANVRLTLYANQANESQNGIVGLFLPYAYGVVNPDYTLSAQTTGLDAAYTKQFTNKHLLNFDLSENTTKSKRVNNFTAGFGGTSPIALLVNGTNPTGGCYGLDANGNTQLTDCASSDAASYVLPPVGAIGPGYQLQQSAATNPDINGAGALTCGTGPCTYYTVSNGANAALSSITSRFSSLSVSDHITPSQRLAIELGLRYDLFQYFPSNTNTPANQLYANTYNQLNCISGTTISANPVAGGPCSVLGANYAATNLTSESHAQTYHEFSPRIGAAYTLDPANVLRFSYGRYVQAAPAATQQAANVGPFYASPTLYSVYGFNSPTRTIVPEVSFNTDLSWEHQFKDNATSIKVTPFYRATNNEFASIVIDPKTNFVALVNGLNRKTSGLELALRRGDFKKNGFSMMLAYTLTHTSAQFTQSPTGGSFVTTANQAIQNFNGFTSFCSNDPGNALCPQNAVVAAAPCYLPASGGVPGAPTSSCGPGTIANPYWNVRPAALLDPKGSYPAYNQALAAGAGGGSTSTVPPNVAALVVNYRHNRLALTPSMQYTAGARYGSPLASQGIDPSSCSAGLNGSPAGDPRYGAGVGAAAVGAAPYDASSCSTAMAIPNPYTGSFDAVGQYRQPSLITFNLQMSYDASKNATMELTAVNLFYRCFGGSKVPWSTGGFACNYAQAAPYVGNFYNPGDAIQQVAQYPYSPVIGSVVQSNTAGAGLPLQLYFNLRFKM